MAMYYYATPMLITKNQSHTFKVANARTINKVIVHIAQGGSLEGIKNWFEDEEKVVNGVPTFGFAGAHFAISKAGEIWQLIDTKDEAFGAGPSNPTSIHIENVGMPGDSLTGAQLDGTVDLLLWANHVHKVPLELNFSMSSDSMGPPGVAPLDRGLGYHAQYGGHPQCPGIRIIQQLPSVVVRARKIKADREAADMASLVGPPNY